MGVELLDQLGEVSQGSGQAVDLVDDDDVDLALPDRAEKGLQGGSVETRAGIAAVIVAAVGEDPALMSLAADISCAGFALGVEGIEVLLEPMVGRDPRIDRASSGGRRRGRMSARAPTPTHGAPLPSLSTPDVPALSAGAIVSAARAIALDPVRPKNLGPFQ